MKKESNGTILKIAGFLEILVSAVAIFLCCYILNDEKMEILIGGFMIRKESILSIFLVLAMSLFQMISGVLALIYAKSRKFADTFLMLGMILLFLQVLTLNKSENSMSTFLGDAFGLLIPFLYVYGATKLGKKNEEVKK